jgi:hypothetical protein
MKRKEFEIWYYTFLSAFTSVPKFTHERCVSVTPFFSDSDLLNTLSNNHGPSQKFDTVKQDRSIDDIIKDASTVADYVTNKFSEVDVNDPQNQLDNFDLKGLVNDMAKNVLATQKHNKK